MISKLIRVTAAVSLLSVLASSTVQAATYTYTTADAAIAIPDNTGAYDVCQTISVPDVYNVSSDVDVEFTADHTWVGDLSFQLRSPTNTDLTLVNRAGRPDVGNFGYNSILEQATPITIIDTAVDSAETMGSCGSPINVGNGCPTEYFPFPDLDGSPLAGLGTDLTDFFGESSNGDWVLCVADSANGDTGTLHTWTLRFQFVYGPGDHGVLITPQALVTDESGAADTFEVALNTSPQPGETITVSFTSDNTDEGTVSPAAADFDASNWDIPQLITVTGIDDPVMDGDQPYTIINEVTQGGADYPTSMPVHNVKVTNLDNNAELTIVKNTVGGDETFNFASTALGDFSIQTTAGTGQQPFLENIVAGTTYDVTETAPPAGWKLADSSCDHGKTLPDIVLAAGESVTCTFENVLTGSITVIKETIGDDGSFDFTSASLDDFNITTTGNTGEWVFDDLLPGAYDIAEIVPAAGWVLSKHSCDDGSTLPDVQIDAGEDVTCTFENTQKPIITVVKNTLGGNGTFSFASASIGNFDITTSNNTGEQVHDDLEPGSYDITEQVPPGWDLTASSCSEGKTLPIVDVEMAEKVTCTFENTKLGSITVIKKTVAGDGTFVFSSASSIPDFEITTLNNMGEQVIHDLAPDTYDIVESVPDGWALTRSACDDGSSPAAIHLAAGQNITCTFENAPVGSLKVVKKTLGGDGGFDFTSTTSSGDFHILTSGNAGEKLIENLPPASYKLAETVPAGWVLLNASCDNGSVLPDVLVGPGESVTCTFENAQLGSIQVIKKTLGGDGTFNFTSTTGSGSFDIQTTANEGQKLIGDLHPGTYQIEETVTTGWSLSASGCDNGSALPDVVVAAGELVTCTFENTRQASIQVVKKTVGGDGVFSFTSSTSRGNFDIATNDNEGQELIQDLQPGTYLLTEAVPVGWVLTNSSCDNGSKLPNVAVAQGESVTCTFENTQDAPQLTLTKSAAPASYVLLGDNISYSFVVENTGNTELTDVMVTDPLAGLAAIDCEGTGSDTLASLAASASATCEAMYSITQTDVETGFVTNQAAVSAKDPSGNEVTANSNQVTISRLMDVCYEGTLIIPDGMIFSGAGTTTYSATSGIETETPVDMGVMVEAPHKLILKAPTVEFNPLFDVEADPDPENPPGGGELQVIVGSVDCSVGAD